MRLAACVPSIPGELVACLEKCGIRTDADLLFSSPVLDIFRRLPSGTVSLQDLTKYAEIVAELTSAPGISGPDLLRQQRQAQESALDFSSGISELDAIVSGFRGGRVYEISGDKQSGKSVSSLTSYSSSKAEPTRQALVLHVVLRHLAQHSQSSVFWMDTTGEFSADRAVDILSSYNSEVTRGALRCGLI
jgi:RAD51-like protein 3